MVHYFTYNSTQNQKIKNFIFCNLCHCTNCKVHFVRKKCYQKTSHSAHSQQKFHTTINKFYLQHNNFQDDNQCWFSFCGSLWWTSSCFIEYNRWNGNQQLNWFASESSWQQQFIWWFIWQQQWITSSSTIPSCVQHGGISKVKYCL